MTLLATLHGLTIASEELALTKGLTIAQPGALRGVPDGAGSPAFAAAAAGVAAGTDRMSARAGANDHLLVVFSADEDVDDAVARGREVLQDLLRSLRLFGDGRVTLGALAWARVGAGRGTLALGAGGRPHGMLVVSAEQEDELRAFCNLVSRRAPDGNELAWALRRFELGCERESSYEALSDHLLALRALLEPEGPASGLLAGRIAALCATPEHRAKLTKRMVKAQALERAAIAGTAGEHAAGLNLARDVADHLRALLRDVICGHLDPNLAALADELLIAAEVAEAAEAADVAEAVEGVDAAEQATSGLRCPTGPSRRRCPRRSRAGCPRVNPARTHLISSRRALCPSETIIFLTSGSGGWQERRPAHRRMPADLGRSVRTPPGAPRRRQANRYSAIRARPARSWISSSRCGTITGLGSASS